MKRQSTTDLFQDTVPMWGAVHFHCRFRISMYEYFRDHPRGMSKTIRLALQKFKLAAIGGIIKLPRKSQFFTRPDKKDKTEQYVSLTIEDKDLIEKLGFTFRLSQAEVLRVAMEWFMTTESARERHTDFYRVLRKSHHRQPLLRPVSMRFPIWTMGRLLEWQIPPAADISIAFRSVKDAKTRYFES